MRRYLPILIALLALSIPIQAAAITAGDAYVNTDLGTDNETCGAAVGTDACQSLNYLITSRVTDLTAALTVHCKGAENDTDGITISRTCTAWWRI